MRFSVDRLDHLVINCRELEVMASWYQRVLGMEREDFGQPARTEMGGRFSRNKRRSR
jgi:catechol 2,3-dioxygenase-like lactoylglutathione lyase family enzyme